MTENIPEITGIEVQCTELLVRAWCGEVELAINRVRRPAGRESFGGWLRRPRRVSGIVLGDVQWMRGDPPNRQVYILEVPCGYRRR